MRYLMFSAILFLASCQGKLSDEQRKQMKDGMRANEIRKISEAEITEGAFELGRKISSITREVDSDLTHQVLIDSIQDLYNVKIQLLKPNDSLLQEVEQQIINAYTSDTNTSTALDNVQKLGRDSILYTVPILDESPEGAVAFKYALGIRMPKKQVILSLGSN